MGKIFRISLTLIVVAVAGIADIGYVVTSTLFL